MMKWTQAKSTSSDEEVQRSLDLLDRVLSEFEDIENDLTPSDDESDEAAPPVDRNTKPKHEEEKKREIYFGTSTVERSQMNGGCKRGVETSVFLSNIGAETSVPCLSNFSTFDGSSGKPHQPSPLANHEVLTIDVARQKYDTFSSHYTSNDSIAVSDAKTEYTSVEAIELPPELGGVLEQTDDRRKEPDFESFTYEAGIDDSTEVITAKGALSLWLKRDEDLRNEVKLPSKPNKRHSVDSGQPVSLHAAKAPPQRLPKPTNIVKPISQTDHVPQPKLKRPLSLMVLNTMDYQKPKQSGPPTPEKKIKPPRQVIPSSPTRQTSFEKLPVEPEVRQYEKSPIIQKSENVKSTKSVIPQGGEFKSGSCGEPKECDTDVAVKDDGEVNEEMPKSPLVRHNTYVISKEAQLIDYSVQSAGDESRVSPLKKRAAPKPPVDSPNPPSLPESGMSLAMDQDFMDRDVFSDSSATEKATQSTQTTLPRKKLTKRSSFSSPPLVDRDNRPDSDFKKRPHSMSPAYLHPELRSSPGHEIYDIPPSPMLALPLQSQRIMGDHAYFQMQRGMEHMNPGMNSRAISHNMLANERYYMEQTQPMTPQYPQFDLTTNPYLLQYGNRYQSQQYLPEALQQQHRTNEHHVLNRMSHAYHVKQRHSINLEHVLSLEQLQMADPRFLAHSKSFNYGPKPVMGIQARRTQAHGTHSLEHPKSRLEQEMMMQLNEDIILRRSGYVSYPDQAENTWFKNNLQDSGFEEVLMEKKRFAPVVRDRLLKNTQIYLPSPPSPDPDYSGDELLDRFDNDSLSGDSDRELSRVERIVSDFHKSLPVLDRKVSRDSMYSNDSLDLTEHSGEQTLPNTTLRSEGQWSAASFDYYSPDPPRKLLDGSESERSDGTEKTVLSAGEEITTLKRLISEGVISLDEDPPDFLPPPPPGLKREHYDEMRHKEKSPSVDSGQGSTPTTIRSDQPAYVKSSNKNSKPSKMAHRAVEKEQLKAVKSLDSVDFARKSKLGMSAKSKSIEDLSRSDELKNLGGFGIGLPIVDIEEASSDSLRRRSRLFGLGSPKQSKEEKLRMSKKSFGSTTHLAAATAAESPSKSKKGFFFSFWKKKQYTLDAL